MDTPAMAPTSSRALSVLDVIDGALSTTCRFVVLVAGTALIALITVAVVARYVIDVGGIDWAEELPKQLFVWFIMAGVVLAVQTGNHIAVDLILQFLGRTGQRVLIVAGNLVIAAAYVALAAIALDVAAIAAFERNPVLPIHGDLGYYALTAGFVLTAVGALSIAVRVGILGPEAAPRGKPEESVQ